MAPVQQLPAGPRWEAAVAPPSGGDDPPRIRATPARRGPGKIDAEDDAGLPGQEVPAGATALSVPGSARSGGRRLSGRTAGLIHGPGNTPRSFAGSHRGAGGRPPN